MDIFARRGEKLAKASGTTFLGKIPIDPTVREGGDTGKPIVDSKARIGCSKDPDGDSRKVAAQMSVAALSGKNELPINIVE